MPLVSVVVPVYNVEEYLEECVRSILNQTLKDIEVICVDDGSSDGSLALLHRLAMEDSRLTVLSQENKGAATARNKGLDIAAGKYVSFLDSDDFFEPNMLEESYIRAEATQAEIVLFRENWYRHMDRRFEERPHVVAASNMPNKDIFDATEIKGNPFISTCGWAWDKLFSREYLKQRGLRFQGLRIYNDMSFTYSAVLLADRITFIDKVFVHQRIQRKGAISTTIPRYWSCVIEALAEIKRNLTVNGRFAAFETDYLNYALHMAIFTLDRTGTSYGQMYETLRNSGFNRLGIMPDSSIYQNKKEYDMLNTILSVPTLDMLSSRIESQRENYERQVQTLKKEVEHLKQGIGLSPSIVGEKALQEGRIDEAELIRMSASYKIGRFITWPYRKVRTFKRCLEEHGWAYTWRVYVTRRNNG